MKKLEEDAHVLIRMSKEMRGEQVINSVVIKTPEQPNQAHIWQTTKDDFFVVLKEKRRFIEFEHFNGRDALNKARAFAKRFVLQPLSGAA